MEEVQHFFKFSPYLGMAGFAFALSTYVWIRKQSAGNEKMQEIASLIESGSMTFLRKEYTILAFFLTFVTVLLALKLGQQTAICYVMGSLISMLCGFIGMKAATKANVRTAQAASQS